MCWGGVLRENADDDPARNQHDDPRHVKHNRAEPYGWENSSHDAQRWIGEGIYGFNEHEKHTLGSEVSLEYPYPVEDQPGP